MQELFIDKSKKPITVFSLLSFRVYSRMTEILACTSHQIRYYTLYVQRLSHRWVLQGNWRYLMLFNSFSNRKFPVVWNQNCWKILIKKFGGFGFGFFSAKLTKQKILFWNVPMGIFTKIWVPDISSFQWNLDLILRSQHPEKIAFMFLIRAK